MMTGLAAIRPPLGGFGSRLASVERKPAARVRDRHFRPSPGPAAADPSMVPGAGAERAEHQVSSTGNSLLRWAEQQVGHGAAAGAPPSGGAAWEVLAALIGTVDAPEDWAAQHDHYLYGAEKRSLPHDR